MSYKRNPPMREKRVETGEAADVKRMWDVVNNSTSNKTWGVRHVPSALGSATLFTLLYFNTRFRRIFKIRAQKTLSIFTCALMPGVVDIIVHTQFISPRILLQDDCDVCLITRSVGYHTLVTMGYTITLLPIANLWMGFTFYSSFQPDQVSGFMPKDWPKLFKAVKGALIRVSTPLYLLTAANIAFAAAATYYANTSFQKFLLEQKQIEKEKKILFQNAGRR